MVAKCLGVDFVHGDYEYSTTFDRVWARGGSIERRYSTDWSQGGPIIERERPMLCCDTYGDGKWQASILRGPRAWTAYGPTPLIAAMRCFVASELGDEMDVPEELLA
jgi:hypothetical protein